MMEKKIIEMHGIVKRYHVGQPNELEILHGIELSVKQGEFLSIVGESGSGKTTLMNLIGALDRPTEGRYIFDGQDISSFSDDQLSDIRNRKIGFVFQNFCLLPRSNALRNVEMPLMYAGMSKKKRTERSRELLKLVGMEERASHKPSELSGGQNQRVAIARAMANNPEILLADEPTGALDSKTGRMIMDLFHRLHREQKKTIVLITHSRELALETQRIVTISDGCIVSDRQNAGNGGEEY